jgi:hypothetical protein
MAKYKTHQSKQTAYTQQQNSTLQNLNEDGAAERARSI